MQVAIEQNKLAYWQRVLNYNILPSSFTQFIDQHYPEQWNKDLARLIRANFKMEVTPAQLRAYAKKFGLVKCINEERQAITLLQRNNPDMDSKTIEKALVFIKEQAKQFTNQQAINILSDEFGLIISYDQLAAINRRLKIKKSPQALTHGWAKTRAGLQAYYNAKHHNFITTLSSYPRAKTVLLASMLGDAELSPVNRGYAVFRDHHSVEQYDWLKFKATFLPPEPYFKIMQYSNDSYSMVSQSHPLFYELESHFYKEATAKYKRADPRKKREKHINSIIEQMCREAFAGDPWLALAILIGDDGTLTAFTNGKTVNFEYIIYSQGFSEESCYKLKQIIEDATGLQLSTTSLSSEYGIRLTISGMEQIKLVSRMINPYLSQVKAISFWKKYDLNRHVHELSKKRNANLVPAQPKKYWSDRELEIVEHGITNNQPPYEIHQRLLNAGFDRSYYATYSKRKEMADSD